MKHVLVVLLVTLALSSVYAEITTAHHLSHEEIDKIFDQVNDNDNTLEGDEIEKGLVEASKEVFAKAKVRI